MMNTMKRGSRLFAASLGLLGLCAAGAWAGNSMMKDSPDKAQSSGVETPEKTIAAWPAHPRIEARALIAKYGEPVIFDKDSLTWNDNSPWRKTVIYRKAPMSFGVFHTKDVLEQTIAYNVPDAKIQALKRFDDRLKYDKAAGELSARSESEAQNYLAMNLADEIVTDKRTTDEARSFYLKTVKLSEAGKSSPYTKGFLFKLSDAQPAMPGMNSEPNR